MAVYYKFKSAKDYELLRFEGPFISIRDLKTKIFESKYLSKHGTDIDIVISNAQTGEEYVNSTDLVPRNSSLVVRRVAGNPRIKKRAKTQLRENHVIKIDREKETDGKCIVSAQTSASQMQQWDETTKEEEDFGGDVYADPSQVLNTRDSVQKATNHHGGKMTKPTVKATADTMPQPRHSSKSLHSYCVPGVKEVNSVTAPAIHTRVSGGLQMPPELNCPICKKIMKDAVLMGKCCFNSYCRECITKHLNSNMWKCLCGEVNISIERDLVLNKTLQDTIHRFAQITNSPQPCDVVDKSVSNVQTINGQLSAGKRPGFQIMKGKSLIPRPGYVCNKCHIPGHFIYNCPTSLKHHPFLAVKSFKRRAGELY